MLLFEHQASRTLFFNFFFMSLFYSFLQEGAEFFNSIFSASIEFLISTFSKIFFILFLFIVSDFHIFSCVSEGINDREQYGDLYQPGILILGK